MPEVRRKLEAAMVIEDRALKGVGVCRGGNFGPAPAGPAVPAVSAPAGPAALPVPAPAALSVVSAPVSAAAPVPDSSAVFGPSEVDGLGEFTPRKLALKVLPKVPMFCWKFYRKKSEEKKKKEFHVLRARWF